MANKKIQDLDYTALKENLKEFLRSQNRFSDYDFDAANISVILDLLTFVTQYNGFYLNMVGSEMFLDSAQLRQSVVSRAKHLGYTPRTARSARAIVDVRVVTTNGPGPALPTTLTLNTSTEFTTRVDGVSYKFTPLKTHILTAPNVNGQYIFQNIEIVEGERLTHRYTVDSSQVRQRFLLPNRNIDETTLTVKVRASETSPSFTVYKRHNNITEVDAESLVYFVQEVEDEYLEIFFGDGVIGKAPVDGNVVEIEYVVSSGAEVLGASSFSASSGVDNYNLAVVTVTEVASNYSEAETIESIKLLAPLNYEAQNRAITENDYLAILQSKLPDVEFIRVWGGENNEPPQFGKVFISAKPENRLFYSTEEKGSIVRTILAPVSTISVEHVFVDPDFIRVGISSNVLFNDDATDLQETDIENIVRAAIEDYRETELKGFNADFRFSRLSDYISDSDPSIHSHLTDITMQYRLFPPLNIPQCYDINFNNVLSTNAPTGGSVVNSTPFLIGGILTYLQDDGNGNLELYRIVNDQRVVVKQSMGTVNYSTGEVSIMDLTPNSLPSGINYIDIIVQPKEEDIISLRNQIVIIEDENIEIFVSRL